MKQKTVSFEVAKALKEAGYWDPGTIIKCSYNNGCYIDDGRFYENGCVCPWDRLYPAPTYIETWLWLWREKKICINCNLDKYNLIPQWWCNNEDRINYNTPNFDDPEEAIAKAIEYLVDNNLIK